jgi:hypothetical protein
MSNDKSEPQGFSTPEPPPKQNESTPVWELVIADMRERDHVGRAKYGTPLQAGNGRNPLIDAYQEALDLAVYLRQAIKEQADAKSSMRVLETYMPTQRESQDDNGRGHLVVSP